MFKFITHRPLWVNLLAGVLLALAIFFIFIFSLNWLTHHDESKTVPSVLGKTFDEAETILEKAGFEVEIQDSIYVDTAKPMKVLKQVPESDEIVKVNRTVYLTINRSVPPLVEMANLVGFSYRSAEMQLENMGLRVGDTVYRIDFARNSVLEQHYKGGRIEPGTKIPMGSAISLVLGNGVGNEQFPVPNLIGMRFCDARARIEGAGLIMASVIAPGVSDTCNAYVWRQNPERFDIEGKIRLIRPGQTVDLWLQTEMPATDSSHVTLPEDDQ